MSWEQTHRRWQALQEIEAGVAFDPLAPLPWREGYDDLFGDRDGLVTFLRYRWRLRLSEPAVDRRHDEHPARSLARVGLAALDLQEAHRAVA